MFIISGSICHSSNAWEFLQPGNARLEACSCMPGEVPQATFWSRIS